MTGVTGYSVMRYGEQIRDEYRSGAYSRALREAIRPGAVVVDIGAGTGIFSLLACRFGAAHVHAIDPNPALRVARAIVEDNGYSDRVTFHEGVSTEVDLPAPADVIISDLRSVLPLFEGHIESIIDARIRLLRPHGLLIPRRDSLWAAFVEAPATYRWYSDPWQENDLDFDMSAGHRSVIKEWRRVELRADQLLSEPQRWATLDYATVDSLHLRGSLDRRAERAGVAHGVAVWFDAHLLDNHGFSNAPGEPPLIYGQAFFPLERAVDVHEGDRLSVSLRADQWDGAYFWSWATTISDAASPRAAKASFRQTTFVGPDIFSPHVQRKLQADFVPKLGRDGQVDSVILTEMLKGRSLGEIARVISGRFPDQFVGDDEAMARVAALSIRYGD